MKKNTFMFILLLLVVAILAGCGNVSGMEKDTTEAPAVPAEAPAPEQTIAPGETTAEGDFTYEVEASTYYIEVVYPEQIGRYHTALVEKWNEEKCFENGISEVITAYYEGNPLENVGFGFVDLDNDGYWELIIGAIQDAETEPAVFEIWTQVDGEPVMLAQAGARIQYVLQYVEEDNMWYVANEGSGSAINHVTCYLMLNEGKFEIVQGIVYDATADEENPWFLTYDLDWDVSNDKPIDEDTAYAILESNRQHYTALELFPYIYY